MELCPRKSEDGRRKVDAFDGPQLRGDLEHIQAHSPGLRRGYVVPSAQAELSKHGEAAADLLEGRKGAIWEVEKHGFPSSGVGHELLQDDMRVCEWWFFPEYINCQRADTRSLEPGVDECWMGTRGISN